jgi:hypothetical protein
VTVVLQLGRFRTFHAPLQSLDSDSSDLLPFSTIFKEPSFIMGEAYGTCCLQRIRSYTCTGSEEIGFYLYDDLGSQPALTFNDLNRRLLPISTYRAPSRLLLFETYFGHGKSRCSEFYTSRDNGKHQTNLQARARSPDFVPLLRYSTCSTGQFCRIQCTARWSEQYIYGWSPFSFASRDILIQRTKLHSPSL